MWTETAGVSANTENAFLLTERGKSINAPILSSRGETFLDLCELVVFKHGSRKFTLTAFKR